ncbi:MAG: glycosyltransferase family 2 protein [Armatimonadetes bacterium]|nr:glycosyltransferase family 2 protein [Armatimonadota bacterium]
MPDVSVVIPTHNRAPILAQTLESVQTQSLSSWECIVVDDHSEDGAPAIAARFAEQDGRFRLLALPEGKRYANAARNLGSAAARADHIVFLDSDDLLTPDCLRRRLAVMRAHPELDFAVFEAEGFTLVPGDLGRRFPVGEDDLDLFLAQRHPWGTPSVIWRREAVAAVGPWDESLLRWQDLDFHARALIQRLRYARFGPVDVYVRHGDAAHQAARRATANSHAFLTSAEQVPLKLRRLLHQEGILTPRRQHLLAGLCFWIAELFTGLPNYPEARRVWRLARPVGSLSLRTFLEGLLLLHLRQQRYLGTVTRQRLIPPWKYRNGLALPKAKPDAAACTRPGLVQSPSP